MVAKASYRRVAIGLMLLSIISGVSLAYATLENGYKADNGFLTDTSESTFTENGYRISIIINPAIVGIHGEENGYKLDLAICPQGVGGALEENGYRLDLVPEKLFPDVPDIALTGIVTSRAVVSQVYSAIINVTVANKALDYETFQVIVNANATTICTQNVTLTGGNSTTIAASWNATGLALGNYTISAYAEPVPGETNTADNNLTGGWIMVSIVGDLTGGTPNLLDFVPDGKVDMKDIGVVARFFGQNVPPAPSNCDITGPTQGVPDGKIDMRDIGLVARHFGDHYP